MNKKTDVSTSQNSKFNSVVGEINRGKEYVRLLEQRLGALKKNATDDSKQIDKAKPGDVKPDDKTKLGQSKPGDKTNPSDNTKPSQSKPVDKTNPADKSKPGDVKTVDKSADIKSDKVTEKTEPIELYKQLYPDVFVERTIVPEYTPNYNQTPRTAKRIVNRDTLTLNQHMNMLAKPKIVIEPEIPKPYTIRRNVPGPTPRIMQLARPKKRHALETCKRYGATMEKFCIENCYRYAQDVTFVPVHDAVYFVELNKRRSLIEKEKLMRRMKRLQEKIDKAKMAKTHDMIRQLYSTLRSYLMPPPLPKEPPKECAECTQLTVPCLKCPATDPNVDADAVSTTTVDTVSTVSAVMITDIATLKLSNVLRRKVQEMFCSKEEKIEKDSHLDLLLVHISEKLAVWMTKLSNEEIIEDELAKFMAKKS